MRLLVVAVGLGHGVEVDHGFLVVPEKSLFAESSQGGGGLASNHDFV